MHSCPSLPTSLTFALARDLVDFVFSLDLASVDFLRLIVFGGVLAFSASSSSYITGFSVKWCEVV